MATLTGTFLDAADAPVAGSISLTPDVSASDTSKPATITQSPVGGELDADGVFSLTVKDSSSTDWDTSGPVPYIVDVNVTGLRYSFMAYLDGAQDLTELLPLVESPDLTNYLTTEEGDLRYWLRTETPGGGGGFPNYQFAKVQDVNSVGTLWTRLTTLPLVAETPAGTYEVGTAIEWIHDTLDIEAYFRVSRDNGATWRSYSKRNTDPAQFQTFFYQFPLDYAGGASTILLEAKCESGAMDIAYAQNWIRQVI